MRNPPKLFELWKQAQAYHCRPSDLLGIIDDKQAFYLDRACFNFGNSVENEIDAATSKAKSDKAAKAQASQVLHRRLNPNWRNPDGKPAKGQYKDPALMKG